MFVQHGLNKDLDIEPYELSGLSDSHGCPGDYSVLTALSH